MNVPVAQFAYVQRHPEQGEVGLAPMMPLVLTGVHCIATSGLIDSGASINVLPFTLGEQLGFAWDRQPVVVPLRGNLAAVEARGVVVTAALAHLPAVRLAFAWARSDAMPLILGQMNFFAEFDVCFFRSRLLVEVRPRQ